MRGAMTRVKNRRQTPSRMSVCGIAWARTRRCPTAMPRAPPYPFGTEEDPGDAGMNDHPVERRTIDRDPREVLSPEVLAVLKVCGGIRETDHAVLDRAPADNASAPPTSGSRTRR